MGHGQAAAPEPEYESAVSDLLSLLSTIITPPASPTRLALGGILSSTAVEFTFAFVSLCWVVQHHLCIARASRDSEVSRI